MGYNTLFDTAQSILLVSVRETQDVCKTVKMPIALVLGLGITLFSTALAGQKGVKTIFTKAEFILDLGLLSVQLTRLDSLNYLDLAIAQKSTRTESACCTISGKVFGLQSHK